MDKMKPGRKPSQNPRRIRITFLVTAEENAELMEAAQSYEDVSAMIRRILFQSGRLVKQPETMIAKEN